MSCKIILKATTFFKIAINTISYPNHNTYILFTNVYTFLLVRWINDENPLERAAKTAIANNFTTPLDEIDAAARILDPIIAPLILAESSDNNYCSPPYGCFLKDFFITEW